jgi:hypothetical protein
MSTNGKTKKRPRRVKQGQNPFSKAGPRLNKQLDQEFAMSENQELFLDCSDYVKSMIDPENNLPQRVPDDISTASAVFKAPVVFELPSHGKWDPTAAWPRTDPGYAVGDPDGESDVFVFPGVSQNIYASHSGASIIVPRGAAGDVAMRSVGVNIENLGGLNSTDHYMSHGITTDQIAIFPRQDSLNVSTYELRGSQYPAGVQNLAIAVPLDWQLERVFGQVNAANPVCNIKFFYHDGTSAVLNSQIPADGQITAALISPNKAFDAFQIWVSDHTSNTQWAFSVATSAGADSQLETINTNSCCYDVYQSEDLQHLDNTTMERPTALSLLASYVGSSLNDGGLITAARLPAGMSTADAVAGDNYSFLSQLPVYANDNALRDGIYTWWCPDSSPEFFFKPYSYPRHTTLENVSCLALTLKRDDPTQAVRIKVVQNIEVLSRSNLYTTAIGPVNPMFPKTLQFAKLIPAVVENPKHRDILSKAFGGIVRFLKRPANWIPFAKSVGKLFNAAF